MSLAVQNLRTYTIEELEAALSIYQSDEDKIQELQIEELQAIYNLFNDLTRDLKRLAYLASDIRSEFKFEITEHVRKSLMG